MLENEVTAINDRLMELHVRKRELEEKISVKKLSSVLSEQAMKNILHDRLEE